MQKASNTPKTTTTTTKKITGDSNNSTTSTANLIEKIMINDVSKVISGSSSNNNINNNNNSNDKKIKYKNDKMKKSETTTVAEAAAAEAEAEETTTTSSSSSNECDCDCNVGVDVIMKIDANSIRHNIKCKKIKTKTKINLAKKTETATKHSQSESKANCKMEQNSRAECKEHKEESESKQKSVPGNELTSKEELNIAGNEIDNIGNQKQILDEKKCMQNELEIKDSMMMMTLSSESQNIKESEQQIEAVEVLNENELRTVQLTCMKTVTNADVVDTKATAAAAQLKAIIVREQNLASAELATIIKQKQNEITTIAKFLPTTMPTTSTQTTPTTMTVKSKSTENKCASKELTTVSYQREIEACTTQQTATITTTTTAITKQQTTITETSSNYLLGAGIQTTTTTETINKNQNIEKPLIEIENLAKLKFYNNNNKNINIKRHIQCELLEKRNSNSGNNGIETELAQQQQQQQAEEEEDQQQQQHRSLECVANLITLAERKSQLRANFFSVTAKQREVLPIIKKDFHLTGARLKQRALNLPKLKILSEEEQTYAEQCKTLVEQRKAELKRKLKQQQTHKLQRIITEQELHLPQIAQLIRKFEPNQIETNINSDICETRLANNNNKSSIMIVKPKSDELKPELVQQQTQARHSPLSDEGCNLGQSPYSSDNEDNESIRTTATTIERNNDDKMEERKNDLMMDTNNIDVLLTPSNAKRRKEKVARSASSDSALGLEVDDSMDVTQSSITTATTVTTLPILPQRRMTLTVTDLPLRPALLPLAEPTALPDSPTTEVVAAIAGVSATTPTQVPTKVLLEERVIGIVDEPRGSITGATIGAGTAAAAAAVAASAAAAATAITAGNSSRRESTQSCISDYPPSECGGVRYVRTPSVVVSDYSDDIMCGITLEEIEYFRKQRMRAYRRGSLDANDGGHNSVGGGSLGGSGMGGIGVGMIGGIGSVGGVGGAGTGGTDKDNDAHSDVSAASSCSNLYSYCGSTISALDGGECYVNGVRVSLERKSSDCSACSISGGEDEDTQDAIGIPQSSTDDQQLADLMSAAQLSNKQQQQIPSTTTNLSGFNKKVGDDGELLDGLLPK